MANIDLLYFQALKAVAKKRMSSDGGRARGPERAAIMTTAKRSARSKLAHLRKAKDSIDVDELTKMFKLPTSEDLHEHDSGETYGYAYKQAIGDGESEEEAEETARKAEQEENDGQFHKWYDAVEAASEKLFGEHGLQLVGKTVRGKRVKRPFEFRIVPTKSWSDSAREIMKTINGVGMFEFNTLKDFLDSGPYSARDAVLRHLHWISRWPDVYGDYNARHIYDRHMR
jgi:hypothetical protein